jgi:hypothetical protein
LASSRLSSAGPDLTDVAMNIVALEAMNGIRVSIVLQVVDVGGEGVVEVSVYPLGVGDKLLEVPLFPSVKLTTSAMRVTTLEAAVIHALYKLDSTIASAAEDERNSRRLSDQAQG